MHISNTTCTVYLEARRREISMSSENFAYIGAKILKVGVFKRLGKETESQFTMLTSQLFIV